MVLLGQQIVNIIVKDPHPLPPPQGRGCLDAGFTQGCARALRHSLALGYIRAAPFGGSSKEGKMKERAFTV